ncbi:hypothetical protein EMIT0373P_10115 [Pseudomonas chlororaphis]
MCNVRVLRLDKIVKRLGVIDIEAGIKYNFPIRIFATGLGFLIHGKYKIRRCIIRIMQSLQGIFILKNGVHTTSHEGIGANSRLDIALHIGLIFKLINDAITKTIILQRLPGHYNINPSVSDATHIACGQKQYR